MPKTVTSVEAVGIVKHTKKDAHNMLEKEITVYVLISGTYFALGWRSKIGATFAFSVGTADLSFCICKYFTEQSVYLS